MTKAIREYESGKYALAKHRCLALHKCKPRDARPLRLLVSIAAKLHDYDRFWQKIYLSKIEICLSNQARILILIIFITQSHLVQYIRSENYFSHNKPKSCDAFAMVTTWFHSAGNYDCFLEQTDLIRSVL